MKRLLLATLAISAVFSINSDVFAADARAERAAKRNRAALDASDAAIDAVIPPVVVAEPVAKPKRKKKEVAANPIDEAEALKAQQDAALEEAFLVTLRARIQARLDGLRVTRDLEARGMDVTAWIDGKIVEAQAAFRRQQQERIAAEGILVVLPAAQHIAAIQLSRAAALENADAIADELAIEGRIFIATTNGDIEVKDKAAHDAEMAPLRAELEAAQARTIAVQARNVLGDLYAGLAAGLAAARNFLGGLRFWA